MNKNALSKIGMGQIKHVYFVGIGGSGMRGIAEVLHNLDYQVSGSDREQSHTTKYLASLGMCINLGHKAEYIQNCDVVVFSNAITPDNPELLAARRAGIPVIPRAEMLAELMRFKHGIAIAGTHGKTTTTSLIASILAEGELDPTYVIGGLLNSASSHARLGTGEYLIAEADESDRSFLHLQPMITVLTNIDADHLESYDGDIFCLEQKFLEFLHHLPFYGLGILCLDNARIRKIIDNISRPFKTYGFDPNADYVAHTVQHEKHQSWFQISRQDCSEWLQIKLNLPGKHNILNALAAVAVAHQVGVPDTTIVHALETFQGISRRCEILGELIVNHKKILLIDDYAHHPCEIKEMLMTVRQGWEGRRIVVIFQPHRYTRIMYLFEDFCQVLAEVDQLLVLDIYSAGEQAIVGADSRSLCRAIRQRGLVDPIFVEQRNLLPKLLENIVKDNDLLLVLGAGDVHLVSTDLVQQYSTANNLQMANI